MLKSLLLTIVLLGCLFCYAQSNNSNQAISEMTASLLNADNHFAKANELLSYSLKLESREPEVSQVIDKYLEFCYVKGALITRRDCLNNMKKVIQANKENMNAQVYNDALSGANQIVFAYNQQLDQIIKREKSMVGSLLNNFIIYNSSQKQNYILTESTRRTNQGIYDSGGMSAAEYSARDIAMNYIIPFFTAVNSPNAYDRRVAADSLPKAVAKILGILPKVLN